jgi:CheY-like chemotaxis protein
LEWHFFVEKFMLDEPKILIIDDEPQMCNSLRQLLASQNYELNTANSAKEAIEILNNNSFDLILLDLCLPDMNGYRIMDHISQPNLGALVIILTGYGTEKSAIEALRRGAYDYLKKPFEPDKLLITVKNALNQKKIQRDEEFAKSALRESEERLSRFMNSASDSFYLLDSNLNFIEINQKGLDIIGKDRDDVIGKNITEIVPDIKTSGRYEQQLEVIKTGIPFEIDDFIAHPIFGDLHFLLKSFKVGDGLGVIATDITEPKRAEKEKEKLQTQLQQAQKIEALGTLAGGIAHDFNNLLMGIQGRASLMSVELDPCHPHLEHINAIEEYIQSAADLTKQLLGFARGGKYEVRPTGMNELVLSSSSMFGRTRKEIRIYNKLHNPSPVVEVDRRQVGQVLLNMYINAWQAMPDGGELYLETRIVTLDDEDCKPHRAKPGRYVKASVTDTGIGMDEAIRQRVFDPFFTTKEKSRGTGLGLASAYGIIKNHGGMISVYSQSNHGTTFNIYLPISKKAIYQDIAPEKKISRGSETILLVDDEEMIIVVGQAMLENLGYRVVVANGGEQAIEAVINMANEIDLVILDLIMPGMDGGKTFDRIREIEPGMLVILTSGYAINGQVNKIMRKGCNGFIQKPFNIYELSSKVRRMLDGGHQLN